MDVSIATELVLSVYNAGKPKPSTINTPDKRRRGRETKQASIDTPNTKERMGNSVSCITLQKKVQVVSWSLVTDNPSTVCYKWKVIQLCPYSIEGAVSINDMLPVQVYMGYNSTFCSTTVTPLHSTLWPVFNTCSANADVLKSAIFTVLLCSSNLLHSLLFVSPT